MSPPPRWSETLRQPLKRVFSTARTDAQDRTCRIFIIMHLDRDTGAGIGRPKMIGFAKRAQVRKTPTVGQNEDCSGRLRYSTRQRSPSLVGKFIALFRTRLVNLVDAERSYLAPMRVQYPKNTHAYFPSSRNGLTK
jgi:hypothetical protein